MICILPISFSEIHTRLSFNIFNLTITIAQNLRNIYRYSTYEQNWAPNLDHKSLWLLSKAPIWLPYSTTATPIPSQEVEEAQHQLACKNLPWAKRHWLASPLKCRSPLHPHSSPRRLGPSPHSTTWFHGQKEILALGCRKTCIFMIPASFPQPSVTVPLPSM